VGKLTSNQTAKPLTTAFFFAVLIDESNVPQLVSLHNNFFDA
jgi:hypothetical protein